VSAADKLAPSAQPMTSTHRFVPQILDAAVEVRGLAQQGGHVLRGRFVEVRPRACRLLQGVLAAVRVAALAATASASAASAAASAAAAAVRHVVAVYF